MDVGPQVGRCSVQGRRSSPACSLIFRNTSSLKRQSRPRMRQLPCPASSSSLCLTCLRRSRTCRRPTQAQTYLQQRVPKDLDICRAGRQRVRSALRQLGLQREPRRAEIPLTCGSRLQGLQATGQSAACFFSLRVHRSRFHFPHPSPPTDLHERGAGQARDGGRRQGPIAKQVAHGRAQRVAALDQHLSCRRCGGLGRCCTCVHDGGNGYASCAPSFPSACLSPCLPLSPGLSRTPPIPQGNRVPRCMQHLMVPLPGLQTHRWQRRRWWRQRLGLRCAPLGRRGQSRRGACGRPQQPQTQLPARWPAHASTASWLVSARACGQLAKSSMRPRTTCCALPASKPRPATPVRSHPQALLRTRPSMATDC